MCQNEAIVHVYRNRCVHDMCRSQPAPSTTLSWTWKCMRPALPAIRTMSRLRAMPRQRQAHQESPSLVIASRSSPATPSVRDRSEGALSPNVVHWEMRQKIKRQLLWYPANITCGLQSIGYSDGEWFSLAIRSAKLRGNSMVSLGNAMKSFWADWNCAVGVEPTSRTQPTAAYDGALKSLDLVQLLCCGYPSGRLLDVAALTNAAPVAEAATIGEASLDAVDSIGAATVIAAVDSIASTLAGPSMLHQVVRHVLKHFRGHSPSTTQQSVASDHEAAPICANGGRERQADPAPGPVRAARVRCRAELYGAHHGAAAALHSCCLRQMDHYTEDPAGQVPAPHGAAGPAAAAADGTEMSRRLYAVQGLKVPAASERIICAELGDA
ncbi:unnamed protein product [Symbiodinium natans]|uniref:Uncharacterized protein n=1 Tax=Symbiodinium natans TaxID=878477 RepID=A0A812TFJ8_9DINO|nr:unnamed protein product [Symbiodinium natans]